MRPTVKKEDSKMDYLVKSYHIGVELWFPYTTMNTPLVKEHPMGLPPCPFDDQVNK